jgi:hypothetical protein
MSGLLESADVRRHKESYGTAVLPKPFEALALVQAVHQQLNRTATSHGEG